MHRPRRGRPGNHAKRRPATVAGPVPALVSVAVAVPVAGPVPGLVIVAGPEPEAGRVPAAGPVPVPAVGPMSGVGLPPALVRAAGRGLVQRRRLLLKPKPVPLMAHLPESAPGRRHEPGPTRLAVADSVSGIPAFGGPEPEPEPDGPAPAAVPLVPGALPAALPASSPAPDPLAGRVTATVPGCRRIPAPERGLRHAHQRSAPGPVILPVHGGLTMVPETATARREHQEH